jgi:hypothetical protein
MWSTTRSVPDPLRRTILSQATVVGARCCPPFMAPRRKGKAFFSRRGSGAFRCNCRHLSATGRYSLRYKDDGVATCGQCRCGLLLSPSIARAPRSFCERVDPSRFTSPDVDFRADVHRRSLLVASLASPTRVTRTPALTFQATSWGGVRATPGVYEEETYESYYFCSWCRKTTVAADG